MWCVGIRWACPFIIVLMFVHLDAMKQFGLEDKCDKLGHSPVAATPTASPKWSNGLNSPGHRPGNRSSPPADADQATESSVLAEPSVAKNNDRSVEKSVLHSKWLAMWSRESYGRRREDPHGWPGTPVARPPLVEGSRSSPSPPSLQASVNEKSIPEDTDFDETMESPGEGRMQISTKYVHPVSDSTLQAEAHRQPLLPLNIKLINEAFDRSLYQVPLEPPLLQKYTTQCRSWAKRVLRSAVDLFLSENVFHGLSVISPLVNTSVQRDQMENFEKASTVKLSSGRPITPQGQGSRKRLFGDDGYTQEQPEPGKEDQIEEDSIDIVPGTPTKSNSFFGSVLSPMTIMTSTKVSHRPHQGLDVADEREQDRISLATSSILTSRTDSAEVHSIETHMHKTPKDGAASTKPASDTCNTTCIYPSICTQSPVRSRKRSSENAPSPPPKRAKPETDTNKLDQESDASFVENTEQSIKKMLRLNLPLVSDGNHLPESEDGTNLSDRSEPTETPSNLRTAELVRTEEPQRNVQNLPRMVVCYSSNLNLGQLRIMLKFAKIAQLSFVKVVRDMSWDTTHLVVPDLDIRPRLLKAMYIGACVVSVQWVEESVTAGHVLPEARFVLRHPQAPALDLFRDNLFYVGEELQRMGNIDFEIIVDFLLFCKFEVARSFDEFSIKVKSRKYTKTIEVHDEEFPLKSEDGTVIKATPSQLFNAVYWRKSNL